MAVSPDERFADALSFRAVLEPFVDPAMARTSQVAMPGVDDAPAPETREAEPKASDPTHALATHDLIPAEPTAAEPGGLQLDTAARAPVPPPPRKRGTMFEDLAAPARRRRTGRAIALSAAAIAVVALAVAGWIYRAELRDLVFPPDTVRLAIETVPADARVYVDGKHARGGSLEVPEADEAVVVVIEAPGYRTETLKIRPDRSQRMMIRLTPLRGHPAP
jgi:hypothetical protein